MKDSIILFISVIVMAFITPHLTAEENDPSGREIIMMVDNRPDGEDIKTTLHMTLINKRGRKRERTIVSYSKEYGKDTKSIMQFMKPADVKGVGFLSWEYDDQTKNDDRWLYLPALKKVRRIAGSSKNDYFMGTDFTYDDMGDRSVDEDEHTLLREEEIDGIKCWVVESVPKSDDDMYSKTIKWIRQDALIAHKVEYYDRQGALLKTLTTQDVRKHQGYWTILRMEMNNIQENHRTILEMEEVEYDLGISDNLFRVSNLEKGRLK
ncbi:MAG: outer membrane lipoprotein-sorting protein [Candidatus Hatepunaea meridiana]|nr:outer membrane lipoprotein-sorting protein [Candidatus Hatepunaea meridiana]